MRTIVLFLLVVFYTSAFDLGGRKVGRVFIHCSASDYDRHDDISVIRKWHVEDRGWSDVGYHFFIKRDGVIQVGRPLYRIPSAQKGHNKGTIAICLHGKDRFTARQFWSLKILCMLLSEHFGHVSDNVGRLTFHGHNEVSIKSCPRFDYKKILRLNKFGEMP